MERPAPGTETGQTPDSAPVKVDNGPVDTATPETDVDPDAETLGEARAHRPVHLHPGFVLVVITGGTLGALARYGLSIALPSPGGWPLPTLCINLAGAFALGVLLETLVRRGPDAGRLRVVRLLAGTGFMGAFTTYSTLAVEATRLFDTGHSTDALMYLATTMLGGALASVAGIRIAAGHHTRLTTRKRAATLQPEPSQGRRR